VAKATILICDWCKAHAPASTTVTLSAERGTSIKRDLCALHVKQIFARFNWMQGSAKDLTKQNGTIDFTAVEAKVMELAERRPFFNCGDVKRYAKVTTHAAKKAVSHLVIARKLVVTGANRGRKLSKAN